MKKAVQIAETLKVTPGAVSQWRKDGDVSLAILLKTSKLGNVSIHWLQTGEGEKFVSKNVTDVTKSLALKPGSEDTARVTQETASGHLSAIGQELQSVPLVGMISAGSRQIVHHKEKRQVLVPGILVRKDSLLFWIDGNELAEEGLRDGDVVVVRDADGEVEGKIVIALIDGDAVIIRRYRKKGSLIHFSAIEGKCPVIRIPEESVTVKYVVTSITRPFE